MPYRVDYIDPSKTAMIVVDMQKLRRRRREASFSPSGSYGAKVGRDFGLLPH